MLKSINTEKIPIKLWTDDIEEGALQQARNLANLPFAFKHIAIMPDCHEGYGMPIGGVLATVGEIIPNAVGVDIGCGMCARKTSLKEINTDTLKKIMSKIRELVPLGFEHHKREQSPQLMPQGYDIETMPVVKREFKSALHQIGSLGGGNHFIEFQKGSDGHIWIMLHSGSRNIGKQVADYYNRLAIELNEKSKSEVKKHWQLAHLSLDSKEGKAYINEMQYCVDFAFANRKLMLSRISDVFEDETGCDFLPYEGMPFINIAHNFAATEKHFGKDVIVHRKGATLATDGITGIIPGSQGTKSLIVRGKGSSDSFRSCSHGAGRVMGRKEAIRTLNLEEEKRKLDKKGIIHAIRTQKDLDEAASAYKNIDIVMQNQQDLVLPLLELTPLAVIKG
ncbi:MAG: RtcB family protein [Bacteroidota bacterium]|jgi:tRNA-splicing ligase RtcB